MKRRIVALIAGGLSLALLVGTWAFYSSTSAIDNQLETNAYGDTLLEKFTPDKDWEPGESITKEVGVTNTGDYDLVVRIRLNEEWTRDGKSIIAFDSRGNGGADRLKINYILSTGAKQYDFDGSGPLTGATDGKVKDGTGSDETVVFKKMDNINSSLTGWTLHTDGWWYYNGKLSAGKATTNLLSSIMLAKNADMGTYGVTKYYTVNEKVGAAVPSSSAGNIGTTPTTHWVAYTGAVPSVSGYENVYTRTISKLSANAGYAGAVYDLYVTSQTCQASADAVTAAFPSAPPTVVSGWDL